MVSIMHNPKIDLSKYFRNKQKVFLINVSETRDKDLYESFSGSVVGRTGDTIAIQIPYSTEYTSTANESLKHTFKLTSEAMGNGIQAMAVFIRLEQGNIFHLRLISNIEMYQRRQVPRIDTTIKLFKIQSKSSLEVYRKEFLRITAQIKNLGIPGNLVMQDAAINLGVGGIRVECEAKVTPSLLAMFFIGLNDNEIPVCALGELAWSRVENTIRMCGYRFIQISKSDQERLRDYIQECWKKLKVDVTLPKSNWELVDRMMHD